MQIGKYLQAQRRTEDDMNLSVQVSGIKLLLGYE